MTDAEIIKALECCSQETYDCDNCPLNLKEEEFCFIEVRKYALDLINRQKAEIELLRKANDEGLNSCLSVMSYFHEEQAVFAKRFYNAGIKEFAERLKENTIDVDVSYGYGREHYTEAVAVIEIDNLVKEMAGDTE